MKIEIKSVWSKNKRRPFVYFTIRPENETEKALIHSLYSVRGKLVTITDGYMMVDFYPEGESK